MNENAPETCDLSIVIPDEFDGQRLDLALGRLVEGHSRSRLQALIRAGHVQVNGQRVMQKAKVAVGDVITIHIPEVTVDEQLAENIKLSVVYEDDDIIVVSKPAGLVVHPGAGNREGTLMNALLHHCKALFALPRAGIVHRLDKDTSGVMVVAKNEIARQRLIDALQARQVSRIYRAICRDRLISGGTVDAPIGRHSRNRLKMTVTNSGKPAISHYRVIDRYRAYTMIQVRLETGRTHQIRVHLAHVGHPLLGDPLYGGRSRIPAAVDDATRNYLVSFPRQALHAERLSFEHPRTGEPVAFESALPDDFLALIAVLKADQEKAGLDGAAS